MQASDSLTAHAPRSVSSRQILPSSPRAAKTGALTTLPRSNHEAAASAVAAGKCCMPDSIPPAASMQSLLARRTIAQDRRFRPLARCREPALRPPPANRERSERPTGSLATRTPAVGSGSHPSHVTPDSAVASASALTERWVMDGTGLWSSARDPARCFLRRKSLSLPDEQQLDPVRPRRCPGPGFLGYPTRRRAASRGAESRSGHRSAPARPC